MKRIFRVFFGLAAVLIAVSGCKAEIPGDPSGSTGSANPGSGGETTSSGTYNVNVSWNANREKAVNTAGGGYRVYYSRISPVNTAGGTYKDVPYVSGSAAPTSTLLPQLSSGTIYIRVIAYSAMNPPGGSSGSVSSDSQETSISLP